MSNEPAAPPSAEALEAVHEFPGPYTIKAFGSNDKAFVDAVTRTVQGNLTQGDVTVRQRASGKGTFTCATLTFTAENAQQVQAIYIELQAVAGLRMLL